MCVNTHTCVYHDICDWQNVVLHEGLNNNTVCENLVSGMVSELTATKMSTGLSQAAKSIS